MSFYQAFIKKNLTKEIHCTAEQLIKLIEDWKRVVEQKPEYIYVSQEANGDFTVTTSDASAGG